MNKGKKKCELLKTIRCQVAKKNGIEYTFTECAYQGECRGTCPKCEEELRYLTRELEKIKQSGKQVAVAGVAAAVIATSTAGCSSDILAEVGLSSHSEQLAGDVAYVPPEETEQVEVTESPEETEVYVTAGVPLPVLPSVSDVISDLQQGREVYIGFERTAIQVEWEAYLIESEEAFDVFALDGVEIIVTYYEDGWGDSAALYVESSPDGESK